jgi:S-DNA-T family DNA segregation ATPase FtsK/SpoIIIE
MAARRKPARRRATDIIGMALLGSALILLLTLLAGDGGIVGKSLGFLFRSLFGAGAWLMPVVLAFAGAMLIAGKAPTQLKRVGWGSALITLGVLAGIARSVGGDFFDPEAIRTSGGYLGAMVGWLLSMLIGSARPVGVVILILAGAVLSIDMPLRRMLALAGKGAAVPAKKAKSAIKNRMAERPVRVQRPARQAPEPDIEEPDPEPAPLPRQTAAAAPAHPAALLNERPPESGGALKLPPLSLLNEPPLNKGRRNSAEVQRNIEALEQTLDQFSIEANVVEVAHGPTITRYEIQLGPGIRVSRITGLADNIAMSLAAQSVRLEAPIPGKKAIGVEVPNQHRSMVTLRELCESLEFHDNKSKLQMALGADVSGRHIYADLTRMPHLLIGGATNSGKSIALAGIIMSLILRMTPDELKMVLIDPKRVEFSFFEGLPHLMCPVVKDVREAPGVLRAVVREMDRRYDILSERGAKNIDAWNAKVDEEEKLPYIVVVIDELADMMMQAAAEVEASICRIAQLARAVGIHLIIATQRPSVNVITGTIKANIPSRMAFSVSSHIDSRTILDGAGAEKLIGRGDMLFKPIDGDKPARIQGCYVGEEELDRVCDYWRAQRKPHYILDPVALAIQEREAEIKEAESEMDPLWEESVRFVVERGQASTSMLQRKFRIGFQRASSILDQMEERGVVGPRDGPRPREVLVKPLDLDTMFASEREHLTPMPDGAYIGDD